MTHIARGLRRSGLVLLLSVAGAATFITQSAAAASIVLDQSTFGSLTARVQGAGGVGNGSGNIDITEAGTMDVTAMASGTGAITLEAAKINLGAADTVESSGRDAVA